MKKYLSDKPERHAPRDDRDFVSQPDGFAPYVTRSFADTCRRWFDGDDNLDALVTTATMIGIAKPIAK